MNARSKLNHAFLNGSVLIAAAIGMLVGSWSVFIVVLVILLAGNVLRGEIRPPKRPK